MVTIKPGATVLIPTGFEVEVPEGFELQVRSRSGLAAKNGIFVTNGPGTIDPDYRGEIKVCLSRVKNKPRIDSFRIMRGDRIAQLVLCPITPGVFEEVEELTETVRGTGGYGSTGVAMLPEPEQQRSTEVSYSPIGESPARA